MSRIALGFLLSFAVAAAACSNDATPVPGVPQTAGAHARRHITVRFSLRVPPRVRGRRSHYVSPATKSVSIKIDAGSPVIFAIEASQSYCSNLAGVLACTLNVPVSSSGAHTFTIYSYDGAGATGRKLAAAVNFPYTVPNGATSVTIPLTMGGIPAGLAIVPAGVPQIIGTQLTGFSIYGKTPAPFSVVATDADGDYIVGPGAPSVSLSVPNGSPLIISPGLSNAPNLFTLISTYSATSPTLPSTLTLTASAAAVPVTGGSRVTATTTLSLYTPWIYVTNGTGSSITAYDEQGNKQSVPAGAFSGLSNPVGITYDLHNGYLYVSNRTGMVGLSQFDALGTTVYPYGGTTPPAGGTTSGIAYAPGFDFLFAGEPSQSQVAIFLPTLFQPPVATGAFLMSNANSVAYSAVLEEVFVTGATGLTQISAFSPTGSLLSTPGGFPGLNAVSSIAFDDHNVQLYATNNKLGTILAFDSLGNAVTTSFPQVTAPSAVMYDPFSGNVYVGTSTGVTAYDEGGNPVTLSGNWANASSITSMAVVP